MSVGGLPGVAQQPLAAAHRRRQDGDRLGPRQRRPVRRGPRLRRDRGLFGRRPSRRAGRSDHRRPRVCRTDLPEGSDTSVDAVVGIYGRYDWEDRSTAERARFVDFLERVVVKRKIDRHPELFRNASPIARVHADAPPFLVIHGSSDTIIPVEQARNFVDTLRAVSRSTVSYAELPGAGHGFDMTDGARTGADGHRNRIVPQPDSPNQAYDRDQTGHLNPHRFVVFPV